MNRKEIKKKSCCFAAVFLILFAAQAAHAAEPAAPPSLPEIREVLTSAPAESAATTSLTSPAPALRTAAPNPETQQPLNLEDAAAAPDAGTKVNTMSLFLRVVIALVILIPMILLAVWVLKRGSGAAGLSGVARGNLRVLDRLAVSPRRFVLIVQIPTRILLVASDEKGLSLLGEITDQDEIQRYVQGIGGVPVFNEQLQTFMNRPAGPEANSNRRRILNRMQSELEQL